jgi:hypothetical protein
MQLRLFSHVVRQFRWHLTYAIDCHQPSFKWITNGCLGTVIFCCNRRCWRDQSMVDSPFSATFFWPSLQVREKYSDHLLFHYRLCTSFKTMVYQKQPQRKWNWLSAGTSLCWLQWVCSLLSGDIILLKINSDESSRNHYLWIINVQKEGQIHPKRPPDVTSCSTERVPGPWDAECLAVRYPLVNGSHKQLCSDSLAVGRSIYLSKAKTDKEAKTQSDPNVSTGCTPNFLESWIHPTSLCLQ